MQEPPPPPPPPPAGGPPPPPQQPPPAPPPLGQPLAAHPPPPQHAGPQEPRAGVAARIGTGILAVVLALVALFVGFVVVEIADSPVCSDFQAVAEALAEDPGAECFDASEGAQTAGTIIGAASALLFLAGFVLALMFTVRGRGGRPLAIVVISAIVAGGLAFIVAGGA